MKRSHMLKVAIAVAISAYAVEISSAQSGAKNDALMAALNAEISEIDGGNAVKAKADGKAVDTVKSAPAKKRAAESGVADTTIEDQQVERKQPISKDIEEIAVTVTGKGETKGDAKLAAFRAAVEKCVGVWVDAESIMQNSAMLKDRVNTISNADIKKYETLEDGKLESGEYRIKITAWVEKKAIAPKFSSVFPAAFADVGQQAAEISVTTITKQQRETDAAKLMESALEGVDRMRDWVRLSVVKGKELEKVDTIYRGSSYSAIKVADVPGKGLYAVRYAMRVDEEAYFKGFVPHFKEVLTKIQEGEAAEEVALRVQDAVDVDAADSRSFSEADISRDDAQRKIVRVIQSDPFSDDLNYLKFPPFCSEVPRTAIYVVDPLVFSNVPGVGNKNSGNENSEYRFMFKDEHLEIRPDRLYSIWLLDRMNRARTVVRCSAYKIPARALSAYWKVLGRECVEPEPGHKKIPATKIVEVSLLDKDGEEIAVQTDQVPVSLLTHGDWNYSGYDSNDVFPAFFVRPMFSRIEQNCRFYASEIQRNVYVPLTDAQLAEVKTVKVRFVGGSQAGHE